MKIGEITRATTLDVSVELLDAEPRSRTYSRAGAMYRPTVLRLQYRNDGDGWRNGNRAKLFGVVLKKDGSDSQNRCDETFYGFTDSPEWVTALIEEHKPEDPA